MFDASKRRVCEVRSIRTNTPLHALNLLNDETYVEASVQLGLQAHEQSPATRIDFMVRKILGRSVTDAERKILEQQLNSHVGDFRENLDAATELLSVGQTSRNADDPATMAALSLLASTLLNLDEAITHE